MKNPLGLSRDVPDPVKRKIRQACGFGCVVCGGSIVEYEHIIPPFSEATIHDPNRMALLCPTCHSKVTSGFMAKDTVAAARTDPYCRRIGYANQFLDIGRGVPSLVFGGMRMVNCPIPIEFKGVPLFEVKEAEADSAPFRLSGNFFNSAGNQSLQIIDNEWRASASNWDVEVSGGAIIIRDDPGHISLRLVADPPSGLVVERMHMQIGQWRFIGGPDKLILKQPGGGESHFTRCLASNCRVGLGIG